MFLMILTIMIILFIAFTINPLINWLTHLSMTKSHHEQPCKWISYKRFKEEFDKCEWERTPFFQNSCWNITDKHQFHAGVISISGRGFWITDPISLHLVNSYVKKYISKLPYVTLNDLVSRAN